MLARGTAFALCLLSLVSSSFADRMWDREVGQGVVFRMERLEGLNLNVYGVKLAKGSVSIEPVLAKGGIYDGSATNGRSTVSGLVAENGAIGGVNGDFFQFGQDPGGDPSGAMVRFGEWLSNPRSSGRYASYGWGTSSVFEHLELGWSGSVVLPGGRALAIDDVNGRLEAGKVMLSGATAKQVYGASPYVLVRLKGAGEGKLTPVMAMDLDVVSVETVEGRKDIGAGEFVLAANGVNAEALKGLKAGERVRIETKVEGVDWQVIQQVMGGGPALVVGGMVQSYPESDEFATTKHPRTAVGVTANGDTWFLVADGRQTQSAGIGLNDLGALMKRWGCVEALNLDGGGSSAINLFGVTLNKPSAGAERLVANGVVWKRDSVVVGRPFDLVSVFGEDGTVQLRAVRDGAAIVGDKVVWTAQGAGWIDQDGVLRRLGEGAITVTALVEGRTQVWIWSGP